ncbi:hypothetical protein TNCV_2151611 [Trichonephila clavipes]|uniref:Uncharacterized protein n=1 Tax=Trichonephila clavipes TaxID=2585209 RepID=A0A8X6UXD4_TRICX|nr:hypothetical protein TNCV_2151611 [Trichonephila clavipes]
MHRRANARWNEQYSRTLDDNETEIRGTTPARGAHHNILRLYFRERVLSLSSRDPRLHNVKSAVTPQSVPVGVKVRRDQVSSSSFDRSLN